MQEKALKDGIVYVEDSTGAYTGATVDLSDAGGTGIIHIVFDGTATALGDADFV